METTAPKVVATAEEVTYDTITTNVATSLMIEMSINYMSTRPYLVYVFLVLLFSTGSLKAYQKYLDVEMMASEKIITDKYLRFSSIMCFG